MAKHHFQTEVSQLLHLIIHSLYSHKEIFLRELVSNSSDALDKLKYLTLTDDQYKIIPFDPRIDITFDGEDHTTFTLSDSGIGMNDVELLDNLGTIAKSGTRNFLQQMTGDAKKDSSLIGQFGVGFYSCFMVADKVEVVSKKAGDVKAWKWISDGKGEFTITEAERAGNGTTVILYLNEEGKEYASRWQIENVVKKYSNHIPFPIFLEYAETDYDEGDKKKKKNEKKIEQINAASALWRKPKTELTEDDYNEFYKAIAHDTENPLHYIHTRAEGALEYNTLFYIPPKAPFDMYHADYKAGVKLYVKRVFITDDDKELMPVYLRFIKGIIDSEDLPLNVSREILQQNKVLLNIKSASVKKILGELKQISENNKEKYSSFIGEYNRALKEGLYSDFANKEALLELVRFKSTETESWTSFAEYKERMKDDQKAIYYITGEKEDTLRNSPLLEAYRSNNIEVLILDDEIDEIVIPGIGKYKDTELKSVNRSGAAEDLKTEKDKKLEKERKPLLERVKKALGDEVKDVVASARLNDSPSCIVADENDPTAQMQHLLKAMGQKEFPDVKPILEINLSHPIVEKLNAVEDEALTEEISFLLLQQAYLVEGAELKKPADFVKRLNSALLRSLG
ncbi:MAG: molecular chaperone HtpG [Spirochaetales bacterium]|nr:MAG: molecular chaperone HtpG [Spirochaetales bacterium]